MAHSMTAGQWKRFFEVCASVLGWGHSHINHSQSWCSWTTFRRLADDAGYWTHGLPNASDIGEDHIRDGGAWGQPFPYSELAHVILPKSFQTDDGTVKTQDLNTLAEKLTAERIPFNKSK